jgi:hypothetical protein
MLPEGANIFFWSATESVSLTLLTSVTFLFFSRPAAMVVLTLECMSLSPKRVQFHMTHVSRTWRAVRNRRKAFASMLTLRAAPKTPAKPVIPSLEWAESVRRSISTPMRLLASMEPTVSCRLLLTLSTVSSLRFMLAGPLRTYRYTSSAVFFDIILHSVCFAHKLFVFDLS